MDYSECVFMYGHLDVVMHVHCNGERILLEFLVLIVLQVWKRCFVYFLSCALLWELWSQALASNDHICSHDIVCFD